MTGCTLAFCPFFSISNFGLMHFNARVKKKNKMSYILQLNMQKHNAKVNAESNCWMFWKPNVL